MASSPIPMLLCGKVENMLNAATEIAKPEVEVVKRCTSIEDAIAFMQAVMNGESFEGSSYPKPQIITMGGGYSNEEQEQLATCVDGLGDQVTWFRPEFRKPGAAGPPTQMPPIEAVAGRWRKALDANLDSLSAGKAKGETFYF